MTANPATSWLNPIWFQNFLRREMAPTPERWQATLRITLSCLICTVPIMTFHLEQSLLVMILMFAVSREDTTTTLLGTVIGIIGLTIGCFALLVFYLCALDLEWLRVLAVPAFITLGLFLNRAVTLGPLGTTISLPLAIGMITPDTISSSEYLNRYPFYFLRAGVLGLGVNLAVQYLLNPQTSHSLLIRGFTLRLNAVEALLRQRATGIEGESKSTIDSFAFNGAGEQLKLIKLAAVIEPFLKERKLEITAQIILMDRLVTAAAALERLPVSSAGDSAKERLLRVADACGAWRVAIIERHQPTAIQPPRREISEINQHDVLPLLAEMERVVELLPSTFSGEKLPDELKLSTPQNGSVMVPDVFTNPEYIHFAVKGAMAAFICYLIFTMFAYQGIYTSVITCIVCSLSTVGASVQKGILRLAGAIIGGLFGVIVLMYVFPHINSLGGFWFPFAIVTAMAAYVNFGSPRVSYCGFQIGVAFYKCVLQTYGTYTELRVVRDRMVGIVLGLIVFGVINSNLWPVAAIETLRTKLADVLRQLARLTRLPDDDTNPAPRLSEAYKLRLQVYHDFTSIKEMLESSRFERGAEECESWEATNERAKTLFLQLLAIIQHRSDLRPLDAPEQLRTAAVRFRMTLADVLQRCSERIKGSCESSLPNLPVALAELEQAFATHIGSITDPALAAHLRGRLALYKETVATTITIVEEIN